MSTNQILELIDQINRGEHKDHIFLKPIGGHVFAARVWTSLFQNPPLTYPSLMGSDFYFIKNEDHRVVAAVEDRGPTELHWVVSPIFRRKGYLSTALIDYILPHLFSVKNRVDQQVSFEAAGTDEDRMISQRVAIGVGFKVVDSHYVLNSSAVKKINPVPLPTAQPTDYERIRALDVKVNYAFDLLESISDELELSYGVSKLLRSILNNKKQTLKQLHDAPHRDQHD